MQYMLLIYSSENRSADGDEEVIKRYGEFTREVRDGGKLVSADRLKPATAATTVRIRNGETLVTDGPFAETKEQPGGYYVLWLAEKDGGYGGTCGTFRTGDGTTTVRMNASYRLSDFDDWVVTAVKPDDPEDVERPWLLRAQI